MNEKQFLFVTCVNNEDLYKDCLGHIEKLEVPEGYTTAYYPVRSAKSMCQGYNSALEHEAKYKVYLHQDTFILNKTFLQDVLGMFNANPKLGLLGMAGCIGQPSNGNWGEGHLVGKWITYKKEQVLNYHYNEVKYLYQPVDLIDGFLMITQYDIPWREDLFDGFHLYDSSQSMEFKKKGYIVGVPRQESPWAAHYMDHEINNKEWQKYQEVYRAHYSKSKKGENANG